MPQKVNPIDWENSEGNVQMSNALLEGMGRKLAVSRLQRDLSDSTVVRNVGSALAYGLIAYGSTLTGLGRIKPNLPVIEERMNENWAILSEGVQTLMRREGAEDPYSTAANLFHGKKFGSAEWKEGIDNLDWWVDDPKMTDRLKAKLADLNPESYIGLAVRLTD